MMRALGLIEVMGLPGAIEAADAALKAASVTLLNIAKVGSGIMTVEITGGVDAVTAAVEAGALSASRITTLRAKHVIPRMDDSLMQTVVPWKEKSQKEQPVVRRTVETHPTSQKDASVGIPHQEAEGAKFPHQEAEGAGIPHQEAEGAEFPHQEAEGAEFPHQEVEGAGKPHHEGGVANPSQKSEGTEAEGAEFPHQQTVDLAKLSNSQLRSKIHEYGIAVPEEELKRLKKQELVNVLERHLKEIKEKGE